MMKNIRFYIAVLACSVAGIQAKESYAPNEPMCQCFDYKDNGDTASTKGACQGMGGAFYDVTDPSLGANWHAPGCYSKRFTDAVALSSMARHCGDYNAKGATCCYKVHAKPSDCESELVW